MFEDIVVFIVGWVISEEIGFEFEKVMLDDLGSVKKVIINKDNIMIVDGVVELSVF